MPSPGGTGLTVRVFSPAKTWPRVTRCWVLDGQKDQTAVIEDPSCAPQFDFQSDLESTETCFLPPAKCSRPLMPWEEEQGEPWDKNSQLLLGNPCSPCHGVSLLGAAGPSAQALGPYRDPYGPRRVARNCNWKSGFCCLPQQKPNSGTEVLAFLETSRKSGSTRKQQQETPQLTDTKSKQRQAGGKAKFEEVVLVFCPLCLWSWTQLQNSSGS